MDTRKDYAQEQRNIFAANLNYYLTKTGATQADIAVALNVTTSTVSDWANAKKYPRVDKMQQLADFFGILMADLREKQNAPEPNGLSANKLAMLNMITSMSDEEIQQVFHLFRGAFPKRFEDK